MKKNTLLLCLLLISKLASWAQSSCPPNIDFEYGNLSNWLFYTGSANPLTISSTPSGPVSGRHTLTSAGTDPWGGFPVVSAGTHSFKLGNSMNMAQAERARRLVSVPSGSGGYHLVFRYAVVLENPGHLAGQPEFIVSAYNYLTGAEIACAQITYVSGALPGFISVPGTDVLYKSWSTASIDLSSMAGQTVALDFTTADCALGGHFGYAYIDFDCGLYDAHINACYPGTATLTAPNGFASYTWYTAGFGSVIATGITASTATPAGATTYPVVAQPYAGFGCPDTFYVTVDPQPDPTASISGSIAVCSGDSTCIPVSGTAGATVTYAYSTGGGGSVNLPGCIPFPATTVSTATTVTVSLTGVTSSGGCAGTVSGTAAVTIYPLPTAWVEETSGRHCVGSTLSFCVHTATGNEVYTDGTPAGSFPYSIDHIMSASDNGVFCQFVTAVAPSVNFHLVQVTDPVSGCSSRDTTISVCVDPAPQVSEITGPDVICEGSHASYSVTFDNVGSGYNVWSASPPIVTITPTSTSSSGSTADIFGLSPGTTTISYTISNCCNKVWATKVITVNPLPVVTVTIQHLCGSICPNIPVRVEIAGTAGTVVSYITSEGGSGTVTIPPSGSIAFPLTPTVEGVFSVTITSAVLNGCSVSGASDQIVIAYPTCNMSVVVPPGIIPPPYQYKPCVGEPYYLEVTGMPGTYTIQQLLNIYTATIPPGSTSVLVGPFIINEGDDQAIDYVMNEIETPCCTIIRSEEHDLCIIHMQFRDLPDITVAVSKLICSGTPFSMMASSDMIDHWDRIAELDWWEPGASSPIITPPPPPVFIPPFTIPGTTTESFIAPFLAGPYTYTVIAISTEGCSKTYTESIIVNPSPGMISGPSVMCVGSSGIFVDGTPGGLWSSSDMSGLEIDKVTGKAIAHEVGTYEITYTSRFGCSVTFKVEVVKSLFGKNTASLCAPEGTMTLTYPASGGTWSSADPSIADITPSGDITGAHEGTVLLTYDIGGGCYYVTVLTVQPTPTVCVTSIAGSVGMPANFIISGQPAGAIISYTLGDYPLGCAAAASPSIEGPGTLSGSSPLNGDPFFLVPWGLVDPVTGLLTCEIGQIYLSSITVLNTDGSTCYFNDEPGCSTYQRPANNHTDSALSAANIPDTRQLTVTPNPNNGLFTLSGAITGTGKDVSIEIMDMLGKTLFTERVPVANGGISKQFRMGGDIANGPYIIKVRAEGGSQVLRFTLER